MECKNNCVDCNKLITKNHPRCRSCANRHRKGTYKLNEDFVKSRRGEGNPNWSNNPSYIAKSNCMDCNKLITKNYLRCRSCANTHRKGTYKMSENFTKSRRGEGNPNWSNNPSYIALHNWVRRNKTIPEFCENCKKEKPYDVANISQEYKRDIDDYKWLCRSCHMREDGRILNLKQFNSENFTNNSLLGGHNLDL